MEGHRIIKAMRIYLGMSQREAAEKLGIYLSVYQKYENIPGYVMHASFSRVCRIMELLHLNPNKFFMEQYELSDVGYEVAARGNTAPPKKEQIRRLRECCPVSYVRGVDKVSGEKILLCIGCVSTEFCLFDSAHKAYTVKNNVYFSFGILTLTMDSVKINIVFCTKQTKIVMKLYRSISIPILLKSEKSIENRTEVWYNIIIGLLLCEVTI